MLSKNKAKYRYSIGKIHTMEIVLIGMVRQDIVYSFDEIDIDDYIYIEVVSSVSEYSLANNACSFFSIQEEKITESNDKILQYRDMMNIAKSFI